MGLTLREQHAGAEWISPSRVNEVEAKALVAAGHWEEVHRFEDSDGQAHEFDPQAAPVIFMGWQATPYPSDPQGYWESDINGRRHLWPVERFYRSKDPRRVSVVTLKQRAGELLLEHHCITTDEPRTVEETEEILRTIRNWLSRL